MTFFFFILGVGGGGFEQEEEFVRRLLCLAGFRAANSIFFFPPTSITCVRLPVCRSPASSLSIKDPRLAYNARQWETGMMQAPCNNCSGECTMERTLPPPTTRPHAHGSQPACWPASAPAHTPCTTATKPSTVSCLYSIPLWSLVGWVWVHTGAPSLQHLPRSLLLTVLPYRGHAQVCPSPISINLRPSQCLSTCAIASIMMWLVRRVLRTNAV
jgi:hypothetical protein